jgi:hypothetical protein
MTVLLMTVAMTMTAAMMMATMAIMRRMLKAEDDDCDELNPSIIVSDTAMIQEVLETLDSVDVDKLAV